MVTCTYEADAARLQQNLSPVVKNLSSTYLFGHLHADYLLEV